VWLSSAGLAVLVALLLLRVRPMGHPAAVGSAVGRVVRERDAAMAMLIDPRQHHLQVLAQGRAWAEGPVWLPEGARVLREPLPEPLVVFSDVKTNEMWGYSGVSGATRVFLAPSGCDPGNEVPCDQVRYCCCYWQRGLGLPHPTSALCASTLQLVEPGSNGLLYHAATQGLIACQHGHRRVALLVNGSTIVLAQRYRGQRFNSPNDLTLDAQGNLYFTDPSYGALPSRRLRPCPRPRL
jgi:gluconolactonase